MHLKMKQQIESHTKTSGHKQYRMPEQIILHDRQWPNQKLMHAPLWCSVDLRDGNQALVEPMDPARKLEFWKLLVSMGFKEIEVGFPSASQPDFEFCRQLIDNKLIPDDVTLQVLVQAREHLIQRTFEAIRGAKNVIIHFYNSTSPTQRRVVFGQDRAGVIKIAVEAGKLIKRLIANEIAPEQHIRVQYSPESFSQTELDFSRDICCAVMDVFEPTPEDPIVLNLPSTVEIASPNVYADQIEWMLRNIPERESAIISLHPHNDRGCAVAATELALMAGADRVEGTLFGNGERTGNVDIVTLAMNLHMHGIDNRLDMPEINRLRRTVEYCNRIGVHERHPWAGEFVFTAFSGSHQDAIRKGLQALKTANSSQWDVPYLPINPADIGRQYEPIIRINSQSGKGGVAYVLEERFSVSPPRGLQIEFATVVQEQSEAEGGELTPDSLWNLFDQTYLLQKGMRLTVQSYTTLPVHSTTVELRELSAKIIDKGQPVTIKGQGNGPLDAFVNALNDHTGLKFCIADYTEHAVSGGSDARAAAYVRLNFGLGEERFGVGLDGNIVMASLKAIVSGLNRRLLEIE